jgi:HAD superfamily hydrolase (TIGR01509 family)
MHRALLIDLDGVLRSWPTSHDQAIEQTTGIAASTIRAVAFAPALLEPAITGRWPDAVWRAQIAAQLQRTYPAPQVAEAVRRWSLPGTVDGAVLDVVRACRTRARIVLVTNATSRLAQDLAHHDLTTAFDAIINSADVGAAKPAPAIFAAALQAAGVAASQALFVDDTAGHMAAASALGIPSHHFQHAAGLQAAVQAAGLV